MTLVEFGAKLHALRKEQGLTLQDVTEKIKVASRIIENIESGNRDALPHTVYTKGFITSYATLLGMNQEELLEDLHSIFDCELAEDSHVISGSLGNNGMRKNGSFKRICFSLLLFALLAGALAVWQGERYKMPSVDLLDLIKKPFVAMSDSSVTPPLVENIPQVNDNNQQSEESEQVTSSGKKESVDAKEVKDPKGAKNVNQETGITDITPEVSQGTGNSSSADSMNEQPTSALSASKHLVHIEVAREQCWIGSETDGGEQKSELLNAGDSKDYPYNQSLRIILGNPSAITLVHDGVPYERKFDGSRREILQFP